MPTSKMSLRGTGGCDWRRQVKEVRQAAFHASVLWVTGVRCSRALLVVVFLRQPFELLQEDQRPVRRNLEPLAASLAGDVVVDRGPGDP